jgi:hypothetical protein
VGVNQTLYTELRKRYETAWTPPPTEFPNEVFAKPKDYWCRFNPIAYREDAMDIGSTTKTFRIVGDLVIQMFAPMGQGGITLMKKADIVADAFRFWSGTSVTCKSATVKNIGNDGFGWYQINVIIPFQIDTRH